MIKCPKCKCELEFKDDMQHDETTAKCYGYFKCAECKRVFEIQEIGE